ncbi:MAG: phosphatidylglycerol lysyltransferase domain-containing protein [Desulfarculaceae bacterium]|jgi:hypothetical protein
MMDDRVKVLDGFKPLTLDDKPAVEHYLKADPPQTSELTFTNLFMWRHQYHPCWQTQGDCLLLALYQGNGQGFFGMPPVGTGDKTAAMDFLFSCLEASQADPRLCRAGSDLVENHLDPDRYQAQADRDQFDYVYRSQDLINLSGRKFHRKKNHLNKFKKNFAHEYRRLDQSLVDQVLAVQAAWCELKRCLENPGLLAEDRAVYEALSNFSHLDYSGGAILIEGRVEAFSLGEPLNPDTAVIHIEKANPEIPGLYAAINQMFAADAFMDIEYINREQDLGVEGLRAAKESYQPHHLVEKYVVRPRR